MFAVIALLVAQTITATFSWSPYPSPESIDRLEVIAWVKVPVPVVCDEWPNAGPVCLRYETIDGFTSDLPPTATSDEWNDVPFPPGAVLYSRVYAWGSGDCQSEPS